MHIDVQCFRWQLDEQSQCGVAITGEEILVCTAHRTIEQLVCTGRPLTTRYCFCAVAWLKVGNPANRKPYPSRAAITGNAFSANRAPILPSLFSWPSSPPSGRQKFCVRHWWGKANSRMRDSETLQNIADRGSSARSDFKNFNRAGVAKNKSRTSTRVPTGPAAGVTAETFPPLTDKEWALSSPAMRLSV